MMMPEVALDFTRAEYAQRLNKTRAAMEQRDIDLLILTDPSNMAWLTGYDGWSFYVHQCVLVRLDEDPTWFGRGQDANGALRTTWLPPERIIGYPDHYVQNPERHPMDYLSGIIADRAGVMPESASSSTTIISAPPRISRSKRTCRTRASLTRQHS
jgi:ectoine hydrolase